MTTMNKLASATVAILAMLPLTLAFAASEPRPGPELSTVTAELSRYLAVHGDVCLGKFAWPVEVTERDMRFESRDAVQMPVLERLGLVSSELGTTVRKIDEDDETVAVKRYSLTPAGRAFYLQRPVAGMTPGATEAAQRADLCAGRISLDKVVAWNRSSPDEDAVHVSVSYTYHFAPASWITDPQALKVFPMVARMIQGEGVMQMRQGFRISGAHWIPVPPGDASQ